MALILDGKQIAADIRAELKTSLETLPKKPGLGIVLVGEDAASHLYVNLKEKAAAEIGMHFQKIILPKTATKEEMVEAVRRLNNDAAVHGIVVQLPLPNRADTDEVIRAIDPKKDVDGYHPENLVRIEAGKAYFLPTLIGVVLRFMEKSGIAPKGKTMTVVANSDVFHASFRSVFPHMGIVPTCAFPDTANLRELTKSADILIVAVGRPKWITSDMVKPGALVIDIGINKVEGQTVGDVDFTAVASVAGAITPVPGGVGPVTIAQLLANTLKAYEIIEKP